MSEVIFLLDVITIKVKVGYQTNRSDIIHALLWLQQSSFFIVALIYLVLGKTVLTVVLRNVFDKATCSLNLINTSIYLFNLFYIFFLTRWRHCIQKTENNISALWPVCLIALLNIHTRACCTICPPFTTYVCKIEYWRNILYRHMP